MADQSASEVSVSLDALSEFRTILIDLSDRMTRLEESRCGDMPNSGTVRDSDSDDVSQKPTDAARGGHPVNENDAESECSATASAARGEHESDSAKGREEPDSEEDFSVHFVNASNTPEGTDATQDVFSILEADLEEEETLGPAVAEKLGRIARSRFRARLSDQKLKEKLAKYPLPQNCSELKPPSLNVDLLEKGYVHSGAKNSDKRLVNVQKMISSAASATVAAMQTLHNTASSLTQRAGASAQDRAVVEDINAVIAVQGDSLALLGMASQELSMRRKFQLQAALPREIQAICTNEQLASTDQLFGGGDLDRALRAARVAFKVNSAKRPDHRFKPYPAKQQRQFGGKPFLGQNPPHFKSPKGKGNPPANGFGKWRR